QYREDDQLIDVTLRAPPGERASLAGLANLQIRTATGRSVPLSQIATISEVMEEPIVWRRSRVPVITVVSELVEGVQAPDAMARLNPQLNGLRAQLPPGYRIEAGGPYEDNAITQASIAAGVPMMLVVMLTLLMVQLRSFSLTVMVLLTAPLGIIGIAAALLLFRQPFGFVAMLGAIAL